MRRLGQAPREEASGMPAPIVMSSVISSWVLLWACLAIGAATVILVTVLFALASTPREAAPRQHHTTPRPRAESPGHALVPR